MKYGRFLTGKIFLMFFANERCYTTALHAREKSEISKTSIIFVHVYMLDLVTKRNLPDECFCDRVVKMYATVAYNYLRMIEIFLVVT